MRITASVLAAALSFVLGWACGVRLVRDQEPPSHYIDEGPDGISFA